MKCNSSDLIARLVLGACISLNPIVVPAVTADLVGIQNRTTRGVTPEADDIVSLRLRIGDGTKSAHCAYAFFGIEASGDKRSHMEPTPRCFITVTTWAPRVARWPDRPPATRR